MLIARVNDVMKGVVAAVVLAGATTLAAPPAHAETALRLAHVNAPDSPAGRGTEKLAELAETYSDGRIKIEVFPSSQLGNNRKILGAVRGGAVDMAISPYPILADIVPELSIYTAGYFYDDWEGLEKVLSQPEFGQAWNEELIEKAGLRPLANFYYGARSLTTTDAAVKSPADLAGKKIRAVPNEMSLAVIRGLGGTPTPVPFPELFQALRQGIVDGQENPLPTIWAQKFYEVQDNLMLTRHQLIPLPWVINEEAWQALSGEDRDALARAAKEAGEWTTEQTKRHEAELIDRLRAEGMTVITPEDGLDLDAFADSVRQEVLATFDGEIWPEGLAERVLASDE